MFCAICENKSSNKGPVITCKNCCRGFHKLCHRPVITDVVPKPWFCRRCASLPTPKKVIAQQRIEETIKKNVIHHSPTKLLPTHPSTPPSPKKNLLDFKWDANHLTNSKNEYCYCKRNGYWLENMLQCRKCRNWFHFKCVKVSKKELNKYEFFNIFVCSNCNSGKEFLLLLPLSWGEVVYSALLMLIHSPHYPKVKGYINVEEVMLPYLHQKWNKINRLTPELIKSSLAERTKKILDALDKYSHWFSWGRKAKQKYMYWKLQAKVPPFSSTVLPDTLILNDAAVLEFCKKEMLKTPQDYSVLSRGRPPFRKVDGHSQKEHTTNSIQNKRAAKMRGSTQAEENSNGNDNTPSSSLDRLIPTPTTFENANHPFSIGQAKALRSQRKERKVKEEASSVQTTRINLRKRMTKSKCSPLPSSSPLPLATMAKKRGRKPKVVPPSSSLNKNNLISKLEKLLPSSIKIPPLVKKRGRPLKNPLQPIKTEDKKQRPGRKRKMPAAATPLDPNKVSDREHQILEAEEALKKYSLDQLDLKKYVVKAMRVTSTGEKQYLLEVKKS